MNDLSQYTALVTGGGGGIGRAISLALARRGVRVLIVGRDEIKGAGTEQLIAADGGFCRFYQMDLNDLESIESVSQSILHDEKQIDILINNAGISGFMGSVVETPLDELEDVLTVNAMAPFRLAQSVLPGMISRRFGRIINISSVAARVNAAHSVTYNMSKAALNSFTKSLSRETASQGVTVNAVSPGLIMTDRIKNSRLPGLSKASGVPQDKILEKITLKSDTKRLTTEKEIADTILFFCSDAAANITGEIIEMAGGF